MDHSATHHIPEQLLHALKGVQGFDRETFIAAHRQAPVTSIRLNPRKQSDVIAAEAAQVPWCASGRYLAERPVFTLDPAYHAGAYYVQEASSMFLDHLLRHVLQGRTSLRVLDLCAAPGGKSTLLAGLLDADSLLVSNEVIRARASILEENMTRWGYANTWVTSNDPRDLGRLEGYFDVIVVDAPCSGSGLFRKDERAIDEWSPANVQLCYERQQRILADIWPALKQNGILVYATCSYSPSEDEGVLNWLAENYNVASLTAPIAAEWGITETSSSAGQLTGYRFFPHKVQGEGFFIAAVQKLEEAEDVKIPRYKPANDKKIQAQAAYLLDGGNYTYIQDKERHHAIISNHEPDWHLLKQFTYMRKAGLLLGEPSVKEWLPDHDIALSVNAATGLPFVAVNRDQALRFLKREDMNIDNLPKGWLMIKYQGQGLGWVKSLGNRVNNYLPKHWRIRMEIPD